MTTYDRVVAYVTLVLATLCVPLALFYNDGSGYGTLWNQTAPSVTAFLSDLAPERNFEGFNPNATLDTSRVRDANDPTYVYVSVKPDNFGYLLHYIDPSMPELP